MSNELTHKEVSSRGGSTTSKKYGKEHFKDLQKKSHQAVLKKYGSDFYKNMSKKGVEAKRKKQQAQLEHQEISI
jgi:hypothetical protein